MNRKVLIRTVGCAAVAAVMVISVSGCSMMKMVYKDGAKVQAAMSAEDVRPVGGTSVDGAADMPLGLTLITAAVGAATMSENDEYALYGSDDNMKDYKKYDISYSNINGQYWFGDKPIAVFYDAGKNTMTNSMVIDIGAYVLVTRDALGNITDVSEVTKNEMQEALGAAMTLENDTMEQAAKKEGFRFCQEDVRVKDMTVKEFNALNNAMHAKYRNQNAVVQGKDCVLYLYQDDMLKLSSFCGSDNNLYGVSVSADYNIADEIDIRKLDSVVIDKALLDMLSTRQFDDAKQVEQAAKQVVAQLYDISEKNLAAISSVVS